MPRIAVTEQQRRALRRWYFAQSPRPHHKACIDWFKNTFNQPISQSTISESLSKRFSHLDTSSASDRIRQRAPQWPKLEEILFQWQKSVESQGQATSGDILVEKAKEIWHQIPEYQGLEVPQFSPGWLARFKERHSIRSRVQHGEAASVPITAEEEMKAVRTICGEYEEDNIYNMDETGLFWRSTIHRGLVTIPMPGTKQYKSRITVVVCTNSTGTDRLPLWFIGHAKQPRALRGLNFDALGCKWRNNKKAWMTTVIMNEWLSSFYRHIGTRSVILCMDNFKPHISATELNPPPSNIHIIWLPKNSTSIFQPLDQGIIQNLKIHYRKQWLRFIINSIDNSINPFTTVTLNESLHWCLDVWNHRVSNSTIYKCFRKSSIIQPQINLPSEDQPDIHAEYTALQHRVSDIMDIQHILNPQDEDEVIVEEEDMLQSIIDEHIDGEAYNEDAILEDVEPPPAHQPSADEAVKAVQILLQFQERQDITQHQDLQYLQRLKRLLCTIAANQRHQSTLDGWIT